MVRTVFSDLFVACVFVGVVSAQTSLYIPGFDPQPVSASEVGVGADGRTTWELAPGVTSGTYEDIGFAGTATLIEGPSDAQLIYSEPAGGLYLSESCVIANGIANCNIAAGQGGTTTTDSAVETASPFEVQGGSAPTPAPAPTSSSAPSSGSSATNGPAQTSSVSTGAPSQTQSSAGGSPTGSQNSGAFVQTASILAFGAVAGLSLLVLV